MHRRLSIPALGVMATIACAHPVSSPSGGSIAGAWIVTIAEPSGTELDFRMTLDVSKGRVDAYSRAGAVDDVVPWYTSVAGRLFRKLPPHGALVSMTGGLSGNEFNGELKSAFLRTYDVHAIITAEGITGELRRPNSGTSLPGRISAVRPTSSKPLRDYVAIAERARDTAAAIIYDPRLIGTKAYQEFFDGFLADMRRAQDDLDAAVAFNSRSAKLPFSHTGFIRHPRIAAMSYDELVFGDTTILPDTLVTLSFPGPGVAMLRISRWERVLDAVDRAFRRIDSAKVDILILDIRANPGGDWTALSPLSHLLADSVSLGYGLASKWHTRHAQPPSSRAGMPLLTSDSIGLSLITSLHSVGVAAVTSTPRAPLFKGKVFLLIDGRAGSASELPAEALRATGRAVLIGTPTAGKMLLALPHRVGDDWIMLFPEADFVSAAGKPIEGIGVAPHVEAPRGRELFVAADSVAARSPLAAAMLRAVASYNLGRFDDAARFYQEANRLTPTSDGPWLGLVFVEMARKRWDRAVALVDERARTDSSPNVAITRALVATASGRDLDRSLSELRAILERKPSYRASTLARTHKRLGLLLLAKGDTAAARGELTSSVALDPRDAEALSTLARLKRSSGG
jgi:hypothetical protein